MTRSIPIWTALALLLAVGVVPNSLAQDRPVVVIDPGHGGEEAGVNVDGWLEKDLVLRMGFLIGAEFVRAGYDVVYTRTTDRAVAWDERRAVAERAEADLLLMLHANRDESPNAHGAEVYYSEGHAHSVALAEAVAEALRASGSAAVLEAKPWPFLQSEAVPTAMVEVAFMTHPVEQRLLKSDQFHHELGKAFVAAARAVDSAAP